MWIARFLFNPSGRAPGGEPEPISKGKPMDPVSALAGILLSLGFSYVPGASNWYQNLTGEVKRLFMLALCLLVVIVEFGFACASLAKDFGIQVTCDRAGAVGLVQAFITAVIANQATYLISPKHTR